MLQGYRFKDVLTAIRGVGVRFRVCGEFDPQRIKQVG